MNNGNTLKYQVFISYHSSDVSLAKELHNQLLSAGISPDAVWLDFQRLRPGYDWHQEIETACNQSHVVLPVLTPKWKTSQWTRYETYAHNYVIPILFTGQFIVKEENGKTDWEASIATPPLTRFQATTISIKEKDDWSRLINALNEHLTRPALRRKEQHIDVPISRNEWFIGRESEMLTIHETLHQTPTAALTQGTVQAISALGGIGKTTVIREYIEVFWRCYPQICWVDCRKGVEAEFARIFWDLDPDRAEKLEPRERAREAHRALRDGPARLLVFDNAEDEQSVTGWIPYGGKCRTIITSRYANWSPSVRKLEMFEFNPAHSREFLIRRTGRTPSGDELTACDELAEALGHLPLALEQAGAFMSQHTNYSFRSYLDYFRQAQQYLLAVHALGTTQYPNSVATTWQLTIAKLSAPARAVLRMASFYADTPIPLGLFRSSTKEIRDLSASFEGAPKGPSGAHNRFFVDAIASELHGYSMARQQGDSIQVHNLVQAVERVQLEEKEQTASFRAAQDALAKYAPDESAESPRTWPVWDELLAHAESLHAVYLTDNCPVERPNSDISSALSTLYYGKGMYSLSLARARELVELIRGIDGERTTSMANALLSYGESLCVLGESLEEVDWIVNESDAPSAFVIEAQFAVYWEIRGLVDKSDRERISKTIETNIIPTLTHWINHAEPFSDLQRVNNTLVLAAWLKREFSLHPTLFKYLNSGKTNQLNPTISRINPLQKKNERSEPKDDASSPVSLPQKALEFNNEALTQRKSGHFDQAAMLLRRAIQIETETLPHSSPKHPHRQNNLALVFLLDDRLGDAARVNARAWELKTSVCIGGHDMTSARILFVRLALDWLIGNDSSTHLGQLRTLLGRPELPTLGGINSTWDVDDLLQYLTEKLPSRRANFLRALVKALNQRNYLPALYKFRFWVEQAAVSLEKEW